MTGADSEWWRVDNMEECMEAFVKRKWRGWGEDERKNRKEGRDMKARKVEKLILCPTIPCSLVL